jgi:hypothetical protein
MGDVVSRFWAIVAMVLLSGCLATADNMANDAGKAAGKVLSVPSSAGQGVADGLVNEEKKSNPYNR